MFSCLSYAPIWKQIRFFFHYFLLGCDNVIFSYMKIRGIIQTRGLKPSAFVFSFCLFPLFGKWCAVVLPHSKPSHNYPSSSPVFRLNQNTDEKAPGWSLTIHNTFQSQYSLSQQLANGINWYSQHGSTFCLLSSVNRLHCILTYNGWNQSFTLSSPLTLTVQNNNSWNCNQ